MPKLVKRKQAKAENIEKGRTINRNHFIPDYSEVIGNADLSSRRIIALGSIFDYVDQTNKHANKCKTYGLKLQDEKRKGLETSLRFECNCGWKVQLKSDSNENTLPVNQAYLWGCQSAAIGYDSSASLMTALDIPTPVKATFFKHQTTCKDDLVKSMEFEIKEAGKLEKELAIEAGDFVSVEGTEYPCIRVVLDGGWSKRTYGHSYDSNCGIAVIIGSRTNKVIYMGTRTKTCQKCAIDEKTGALNEHVCNKNWTESSTAMESSIIREGFEASIPMHGLVYSSFVGDGDSSVHVNVQYVYHGIEVVKIECINHVVRNLKTKLFDISKNTVKGNEATKIPLEERKIFNKEFPRFEIAIRQAVKYYQAIKTPETWKSLRHDIKNIPYHVFGDHSGCKSYFCSGNSNQENLLPCVTKMHFWVPLQQALERVANLSKSLIENETSNRAESFMSIANTQMEGKRKNLGQNYLYKLRMTGAVFSYNTNRFWLCKAYRNLFNKEPSILWKTRERAFVVERSRKRAPTKKTYKSNLGAGSSKGDLDYGSNAKEADLADDVLEPIIEDLKRKLQVDEIMRNVISVNTRDQSASIEWFSERKQRITASVAGNIFKLKATSDNTTILNQILGKHQSLKTNAAIVWGNQNEASAIKSYEDVMNIARGTVERSGLIVSLENGIFGASPDGLIGEDGLLEVKCPYSIRNGIPQDWPTHSKYASPIKAVGDSFAMKKNHAYYYQVIMQLYVSGRSWCDFFIWTPHGHYMERIEKSCETEKVWESLKKSLETFWQCDLAPELVNSRFERGFTEYRCSKDLLDARLNKEQRKRAKDASALTQALESAKRRKI